MCNLYSMTTNQKAIRDLFKVSRDTTGNLPRLPAIFPDQVAPVVRMEPGSADRRGELRQAGSCCLTQPRKPLRLRSALVQNGGGYGDCSWPTGKTSRLVSDEG